MRVKRVAKSILAQLGILDYSIFVLNDQLKAFSYARLSRNLRYRTRGAPDGLPIPPGYLIWLVIGSSDVHAFLESGAVHAFKVIRRMLEENSLTLDQFDTVLDFGCGCGRIMRHWKDQQHAQLYGSDYNPTLIRWCKRNLPFARFETNQLAPPLSIQTAQFDFVYARSVFTHLSQDLQFAWLDELWRVLKPGGYLLFTVSGDQFIDGLTAAEAEQYRAGHIVVRAGQLEGKNYCATYHPPEYVSRELVRDCFKVVSFRPGDVAEPFCMQDTYLVKKVPGASVVCAEDV